MSRHAQIEEVSDSDPEIEDPDEVDIGELDAAHPASAAPSLLSRADAPAPTAGPIAGSPAAREKIKNWQCLYPVYFDQTRTRDEGRRVNRAQAVPNPLAREMCDAVAALGLEIAFEPDKTHPKDWANPGRVRVNLKEGPRGRVAVNNSTWTGRRARRGRRG